MRVWANDSNEKENARAGFMKLLVFAIALAIGAPVFAAPQNADGLEERIKRIENGLLPPVVIKGQPVEPMKLADRMKFYKT
ncbi:MAG: hypothetical protein M3Q89_01035, partial [Verrucomicrobiota bacterium]|nr:hypothetical protein [Verrucomicrobiota bacterium]